MAAKVIVRSGLTGGTSGSLDYIDGDLLTDMAFAIVGIPPNVQFFYLDEDSAEEPDGITIITPVSNAGDKRWKVYNVL